MARIRKQRERARKEAVDDLGKDETCIEYDAYRESSIEVPEAVIVSVMMAVTGMGMIMGHRHLLSCGWIDQVEEGLRLPRTPKRAFIRLELSPCETSKGKPGDTKVYRSRFEMTWRQTA